MAVALAERGITARALHENGRKPLVNEVRALGEFFNIQFHHVYFGFGVPHGRGDPVLTIPGFTASDASLFYLNTFLRRINYNVCFSGIIYHRDPEREIERLSDRAEEIYKITGKKVHLVGHSLGGVVAKGIGLSSPHAVASVNTLGSPLGDFEEGIDPLVLAWARMIVPSFSQPGEVEKRQKQLSQPLDEKIRTTYIYTKEDGVVRWQSTIDFSNPQAKNIEVPGTHSALIANPHAFKHVAIALANAS